MQLSSKKVEFGDFQTPLHLALQICERLRLDGYTPATIIEPTCGKGSFVKAGAAIFCESNYIRAYDINESYVSELLGEHLSDNEFIKIGCQDYFQIDWEAETKHLPLPLMVLGNFPWVTNSVLGSFGGKNLPSKSNFLKLRGVDALTGKSNFDISEWMLIDVLKWLGNRPATIAMLCKTSVARKIISFAQGNSIHLADIALFKIDAMENFGASVDACLFVTSVNSGSRPTYDYRYFESLESTSPVEMGTRRGARVSNISIFEDHSHLIGDSPVKWRSGIKHDAVRVMEFTKNGEFYVNGYGEAVHLEEDFMYPMLKGTDVYHDRTSDIVRYMLVPQRFPGDSTSAIERSAPRTWAYLNKNQSALASRKSSIYKGKSPFAIFGVGSYSFQPWKIAISSLHKQMIFRLVGPYNARSVVFDDTVYFVSFSNEEAAKMAFEDIQHPSVRSIFSSLIFNDEKRTIKANVLNIVDWSLANRRIDSEVPA